MGIKISRVIFSFLFSTIGPFVKSKKIIEKNLLNFPQNISESEKNKIVINMWKNYGMTFIEYIFLDFFRKSDSHIEMSGEHSLSNLISTGKPVIFISGHSMAQWHRQNSTFMVLPMTTKSTRATNAGS